MKMLIFCLIILSLGLVGCTKAEPKMEQNKELSGVSVVAVSKSVAIANGDTATINGTCTKIFSEIEVSFSDSPEQWYNIQTLDTSAVVNCSVDGTFTVNFDTTNPIYAESMAAQPPSVMVQFRGVGEFGKSKVDDSTISITYAGPGGVPLPPAIFSLNSPVSNLNSSSSIQIQVSGVATANTITIYSDNLCSLAIGSDVADVTGAQIDIAGLNDGTYTFYATATNTNGTSACSTNSITYTRDSVAPSILSVTADAAYNKAHKFGDSILVKINFGEVISVSGTITIDLNNTKTDVNCAHIAGDTFLTCTYTVDALAQDTSGLTPAELNVAQLVVAVGAYINDAAGNSLASPSAPAIGSNLATNNQVHVDTLAPTVLSVTATNVDGYYNAGDNIIIEILFSEAVEVTNTPSLKLNSHATTAYANYTSGSNTNNLVFTYQISTGENSTDLDYVDTTSLVLNTGTIKDAALNSATLTLPAPSVAAAKALVVDTTPPTVSSFGYGSGGVACVAGNPTASETTCGPSGAISVALSFSEPVTSAAQTVTFNNSKTGTCGAIADAGILSCSYTVGATGTLADVTDFAITGFSVAITDKAGNPYTFAASATPSNVNVDTTAPKISSITTTVITGDYFYLTDFTGGQIPIKVTFSENITVAVNTSLTVNLNTTPIQATAVFASAIGNYINFQWTAAEGFHSMDLDMASLNINTTIIKDAYGNQSSGTDFDVVNSFASAKDIYLDLAHIVTVDPVYPNFGSDWNDYVDRNSGWYNSSDVACSATGNGPHTCIHGGEKKKFIINNQSTCTGLTLIENLNLFEWECVIDGPSSVAFYTKGLKSGVSLSDLIDAGTLLWLQNWIYVQEDSTGFWLAESSAAAWWGNQIEALSDASTLNVPSKIYIATGNTAIYGKEITADKIGIVVPSPWVLTFVDSAVDSSFNCYATSGFAGAPGDSRCFIFAEGQKYLWIEGVFAAKGTTNANYGILLGNTSHSRLEKVTVTRTINNGAPIGAGISLTSASKNNLLTNLVLGGNGGQGLNISGASKYNVVNKVTAFSGGSSSSHCGVNLADINTTNNTLTELTVFSNNMKGLCVANSAINNTISHVTAANNGNQSGSGDGIFVGSVNTINQAVAINNGANGFTVTGAGNSKFSQIISANNISKAISYTTSTANFFHNIGLNGTSDVAVETAIIASVTNTFVGKVTVNDIRNLSPSYTFGVSTNTNDFGNFENRFRGWGLEGGSFPSLTNIGKCTTTCQTWDWSIKSTDAILQNTSGSLGTIQTFLAPAPNCPVATSNNFTVQDNQTQIFLANAVEMFGDSSGDDDGLCEFSESCIYSPNYGSYQGHGAIDFNQSCTFDDIGLSGIKLYSYPTTGI